MAGSGSRSSGQDIGHDGMNAASPFSCSRKNGVYVTEKQFSSADAAFLDRPTRIGCLSYCLIDSPLQNQSRELSTERLDPKKANQVVLLEFAPIRNPPGFKGRERRLTTKCFNEQDLQNQVAFSQHYLRTVPLPDRYRKNMLEEHFSKLRQKCPSCVGIGDLSGHPQVIVLVLI